jgi:hypothetical protein
VTISLPAGSRSGSISSGPCSGTLTVVSASSSALHLTGACTVNLSLVTATTASLSGTESGLLTKA